ncbi:MAG: glycosyltransferase family 1 protein [Mycobacterium sp.]
MRTGATRIRYGALALRPGGSGVQTYIRELLNELPRLLPDAHLTALVQSDVASELPSGLSAIQRPVAGGSIRAVMGAAPVTSCDLFHGLDVDIPIATSATTVATIHDLSVIDMPTASSRWRAFGETRLVRNALRRTDVLLAVSEFTAGRIEEVCGRQAHVVGLAPASWARQPSEAAITAVRTKYQLPDRFVLQVGTVEPRKNVHLVAEAARQLDVPCVLAGAGSVGPAAPPTALGLGYVDVGDLPGLYAAATATAYASRYEGYGLPPVEAMACGGAVVASAVGALPEVVGDGAILVDSQNVDDWVAALRPVLFDADTRRQLCANAISATADLSWERTAAETIDVYRRSGAL